jgi:hypothetical protein
MEAAQAENETITLGSNNQHGTGSWGSERHRLVPKSTIFVPKDAPTGQPTNLRTFGKFAQVHYADNDIVLFSLTAPKSYS